MTCNHRHRNTLNVFVIIINNSLVVTWYGGLSLWLRLMLWLKLRLLWLD